MDVQANISLYWVHVSEGTNSLIAGQKVLLSDSTLYQSDLWNMMSITSKAGDAYFLWTPGPSC